MKVNILQERPGLNYLVGNTRGHDIVHQKIIRYKSCSKRFLNSALDSSRIRFIQKLKNKKIEALITNEILIRIRNPSPKEINFD